MGDIEIPDELIDQLLGEYQGPEQLTGRDGLINRLRKRLIERAAGVELEQHLGYPPGGEALERELERLRRERRIARRLTLAELVEVYLAQHDVQPVTIEKLRYLLSKATAVFGDRKIGELTS